VIGLVDGPRPPFRSRGYWLYGGGRDLLHLTIAADAPAASRPPQGTGWFDHLAFTGVDLAATIARLDAAGIAYARDEVPMLGQVQLFLTDPAGIGIELNFTP
jgi:catechol 2,3-dioxygenase-like lactoylglutathione lyase family enzyme